MASKVKMKSVVIVSFTLFVVIALCLIVYNKEENIITRDVKRVIKEINKHQYEEIYDNAGVLYKNNYTVAEHVDYLKEAEVNTEDFVIDNVVTKKEKGTYYVEVFVKKNTVISKFLFWYEKQPKKWALKNLKFKDNKNELYPRFLNSRALEEAEKQLKVLLDYIVEREYTQGFKRISEKANFEDQTEFIMFIEGNEDEAGSYIREYEILSVETVNEEEDPLFTVNLNIESERQFVAEILLDLQDEYKAEGIAFLFDPKPKESDGEPILAFISEEEQNRCLELSINFIQHIKNGEFEEAYKLTSQKESGIDKEQFEGYIRTQMDTQEIVIEEFKHQYQYIYSEEGVNALRNIIEVQSDKGAGTVYVDCITLRTGEIYVTDFMFVNEGYDYADQHGNALDEICSNLNFEENWESVLGDAHAQLGKIAKGEFESVWESTNLGKSFQSTEQFAEYCKAVESNIGKITPKVSWFYCDFDGLRRSAFLYYQVFPEGSNDRPHMVAMVELGEDRMIKGIHFKRFLYQEGSL